MSLSETCVPQNLMVDHHVTHFEVAASRGNYTPMVACDVIVIKSTKSWGCSHKMYPFWFIQVS